jgi:hypothetical protein
MEYVAVVNKHLDVLNKIGAIVEKAVAENKPIRRPTSHNEIRTLIEQDPTGNSVPEEMMPRAHVLDMIHRSKRQKELYGNLSFFDQFDLPKDINDEIMAMLPDELKDKKITLTYQHTHRGHFIPPHVDHERCSSLFYVISPPDMKTVWYKRLRDFVIYEKIHHLNPDDLEPVFETVMDQKVWYLINQTECHSAHKLPNIRVDRHVFCIEFVDLKYDEVVKYFA